MKDCIHIERPDNLTDIQWKSVRDLIDRVIFTASYAFQDNDWEACKCGMVVANHPDYEITLDCEDCR